MRSKDKAESNYKCCRGTQKQRYIKINIFGKCNVFAFKIKGMLCKSTLDANNLAYTDRRKGKLDIFSISETKEKSGTTTQKP